MVFFGIEVATYLDFSKGDQEGRRKFVGGWALRFAFPSMDELMCGGRELLHTPSSII
jgi:hypothetical protein